MSYTKTTWTNGDTITAEKLNNNENQTALNEPLRVPFELQEDESVTTTATFADVKAAVLAGREVTADLSMGDSLLRLPLRSLDDASDPTTLQFMGTADVGSGETPEPIHFRIDLTSSGVTSRSIALTVAQE